MKVENEEAKDGNHVDKKPAPSFIHTLIGCGLLAAILFAVCCGGCFFLVIQAR